MNRFTRLNKNMQGTVASCCTLLLCFLSAYANAQAAHPNLRQGNHAYEAENYAEAEEHYRKGLEKEPNSLKSAYNLGNTLYHQKRFDEAVKHYEKALPQGKNNMEKSQISYNMGNALLQQRKFSESIDAYKNAIRNNPNNNSAKYNLNVALRKQKEEEKKNQKNKDDKNNKGENKPNDKENNEKGKPNESQNGTPQTPEKPTQPENETPPAEAKGEAKHEKARELLRIMDNEEKKVQTKLHKYKGARAANGKDW
jgi:Ca-activated chloride channel homolog